METELLAPAKNIEIAKAAIDAGADAVYIGASDFGARQKAGNSLDDIRDLVQYAHKFYVKVMVTVNTIIKDSELIQVKSLIKDLYDIGVDSIIVQDMAIVNWAINGKIPPIELHISTQCNNRSEEKIEFFKNIGLKRVVLARELSIKQIKNIIDKNPEIEIECFAHGALCVSYSGQCYMSQYIGGRSANRGECAQPCRKKYSVIDDKGNILVENKHVLCLKDFNTSNNIEELVKIGVKSFKIEGRLKDKNYVRNVVGYYRKLLDKYSTKSSSGITCLRFEPNVNKTFNRGYTSYFLKDREKCFNFNSPKFIGEPVGKVVYFDKSSIKLALKDNIILNSQDGLTFGEDGTVGCLINKAVKNIIYPNKMPEIKIGMNVYRNVDTSFEKEINNANTKRQIGLNILFKNSELIATDEDNNTASVKVIETEIPQNHDKALENFKKSLTKTGESDFYIRRIDIQSNIPFIPISKINSYRRLLLEKVMEERLKNYKRQKQAPLRYTNYPQKEIDYRGNVYNKEAEDFYKKCGAEVIERAPEEKFPNNKIELMRTKHCIKYALNKCKSPDKLFLIDEKGKKYGLEFDCKNCEMAITMNY